MANMRQIPSPSSPSSSALEANTFGPWLDLPDYLTEKIMERLPILDYVRFGAVCGQWRTIQENLRRRHAPYPPPMPNLPWFIPRKPQQEPVDCFSPFPEEERQSHRIRIPLPRLYLEHGMVNEWRSCNCYGWLVLEGKPRNGYFDFTLLNPISGVQIEIPRVGNGLYNGCKVAASPPPGCLVLVMAYDESNMYIHLFRQGDDDWTELQFPQVNLDVSKLLYASSEIVWKGKVYCMFLCRGLMVIDPDLPSNPTVEFLEMDQSQLPALRDGWIDNVYHTTELFLIESNGKLLLVVESFELEETFVHILVSFQVFEADFSVKRWVRVESLGDRVLFMHQKFVCSILAADIGVEGNCIYSQDPFKIHGRHNIEEPVPWSVFNLGTGNLTESTLSYAPTPYTHFMLVPRIC